MKSLRKNVTGFGPKFSIKWARRKLEKDVEKDLIKLCKLYGVVTYKFTSPSKNSVPDRILIVRGLVDARVGFLELKKPGDYPTPLQERELRIIKAQGGTAAWADNAQDVETFIQILLAA